TRLYSNATAIRPWQPAAYAYPELISTAWSGYPRRTSMPHDPALVTGSWNTSQAAPAVVRVARPLSIWHATFSFPVMLSLALVVLSVLTVRTRFNDPDLWWHLKIGATIWN